MRRHVVRRYLASTAAFLAVFLCLADTPDAQVAGTILIQEPFEDVNVGSRGWYDFSFSQASLSTVEKYAGTRSYECRFAVGATGCAAGSPARHALAETDAIYIAYYIKHSTNWVGSGQTYHPHMFHFLTNLDGAYIGLAYTHLTAYVEENAGIPLFATQDSMNVDEGRVGVDLTNVTEQRAIAGCNGDSDGYGSGDCYSVGTSHRNGKIYSSGQVLFDSTPGSPNYKGNWHLIEAYFKLNSIVAGKGAKDGIVRYWYDGRSVMDHSNIVMRTGANPTMKFNQLMIAPYIGDGSPVDQTMWIDNLTIGTARLQGPSAPKNLRVIR